MSHRVSNQERARLAAQAESLRATETSDPGSPERRRTLLRLVNRLRLQLGSDTFPDEDEEPPELGFYRRARALGMVGSHR